MLDRITEIMCIVCRETVELDAMVYLLTWYMDNSHVTQYNRIMNTHTSANHWCHGLPRPCLVASLPQPASHLALATTFGTVKVQEEVNVGTSHSRTLQSVGSGQVEVTWMQHLANLNNKSISRSLFWRVEYWWWKQISTKLQFVFASLRDNMMQKMIWVPKSVWNFLILWLFAPIMTQNKFGSN